LKSLFINELQSEPLIYVRGDAFNNIFQKELVDDISGKVDDVLKSANEELSNYFRDLRNELDAKRLKVIEQNSDIQNSEAYKKGVSMQESSAQYQVLLKIKF